MIGPPLSLNLCKIARCPVKRWKPVSSFKFPVSSTWVPRSSLLLAGAGDFCDYLYWLLTTAACHPERGRRGDRAEGPLSRWQSITTCHPERSPPRRTESRDLLFTDNRQLATDNWPLATDNWLLATGY